MRDKRIKQLLTQSWQITEMNSGRVELRTAFISFSEKISEMSGNELFRVAFRLTQDAGFFVGTSGLSNKSIGCILLSFVATQSFAAANAAENESDHF